MRGNMPESKAFGDVMASNSSLVMPSIKLLTAAGTLLLSLRCSISGLVSKLHNISVLTVRIDPDMACCGFYRFTALTDFIYQHYGLPPGR